MATIGGFTRAGSISRTVPNPSQQAPPGIVCGHGDPVIRLQVKNNGVNQGRFFYKCPRDPPKCRFFKWEDEVKGDVQSSPARATPGRTLGSSFSSATANPTSPTPYVPTPYVPNPRFPAGAGQTLGSPTRPTPGNVAPRPTTPARTVHASQPTSSSGSSTQMSTPSPAKRARTSRTSQDSDEDEVAMLYESNAQAGRNGRDSAPSTSKKPVLVSSQTAEEAIEEDWDDDDIADFEDVVASQEAERGTGLSHKKSNSSTKFTSFASPATPSKRGAVPSDAVSPLSRGAALLRPGNGTKDDEMPPPKTPPRPMHSLLHPGAAPVTPVSLVKAEARQQSSTPGTQWEQILNDPEHPFHARAQAMRATPSNANGAEAVPSSSPSTANTTPLLPSALDPPTPSARLRTVSTQLGAFTASMAEETNEAARSAETTERLLVSARKKTEYHERKNAQLTKEVEQLREKLRLLEAENAGLRAGRL